MTQVTVSIDSTISKSFSETLHYIVSSQDKRFPCDLLQPARLAYNLENMVKINISTTEKIQQRTKH